MPSLYITSTVSQDEDSLRELHSKFVDFLARTLHEPKSFVQVIFSIAGVKLGTTPGPSAHIQLFSHKLSEEKINNMNAGFSKLLSRYTGVPEDRIIIYYFPMMPHQVGWNGRLST